MESFFLGVVVALGPSVAALAWLIWYSSAIASSDRENRSEADEVATRLGRSFERAIKEPLRGGEQVAVIELAEVRLERHRQFGTALHQVPY